MWGLVGEEAWSPISFSLSFTLPCCEPQLKCSDQASFGFD